VIDARRAELLRRLEVAQRDLTYAEEQVEKWRATRQLHSDEIKELRKQVSALNAEHQPQIGLSRATSGSALTNYMEQEFEWSKQLKSKLKRIFGIDDFRLCQKGCVTHVRLTFL
jgi:type I site-specific restriction endonuclease